MFERGLAEVNSVDLPHDAMLTTGRSGEDGNAHLSYYREGTWQYKKTLDVPADWASRRITLHFEGVYRDAMVFVNGAFAGQAANGYLPFYISLDPFLHYGGANEILVEAQAHGDTRWYSGAGIYRPVSLLIGDLVHIGPHGPRISTPAVDDDLACVEVITPIVNAGTATQRVTLETEIRDSRGSIAVADSKPVTVLAGETAFARQLCYVPEPSLWSADSPAVYSAQVSLKTPDGQSDGAQATFGIRSISVDPRRGLRVNGKPVKLRGACLHHDHGILGTAEFDRAADRRVALVKAAGFNAIRSGGHSTSRAILDAADRHGVYVIDETWDMWHMSKTADDYSRRFEKWWQGDIDALVARGFNHPSLIGYSIGSEIIEIGTRHGARQGRLVAERIRERDPGRFLTNSINAVMNMWVTVPDEPVISLDQIVPGGDASLDDNADAEARPESAAQAPAAGEEQVEEEEEDGSFNATAMFMEAVSALPGVGERLLEAAGTVDVFGLNYGHVRVELDKDDHPNRVMLNTETFPAKIAESWGVVLANPQVIGDFTWSGWDYLGEPGVGRPIYPGEPKVFTAPWPWLTACCGDIDLTGRRLPISFYREVVFGVHKGPFVAVQDPAHRDHPMRPQAWSWSDSTASWTWDLAEGELVTVEGYADADEIAFLVNGAEAARATVGEDTPFRATAEVPYRRGTLEAAAYRDGVEIGRCSIESAGSPAKIGANADKSEIRADTQDLVYVDIAIQDEAGVAHPGAEIEVTLEIEGPARLQGLGSARPKTEEAMPFLGNTCTTFRGRALAAVRYRAEHGKPADGEQVTIRVTAAGLSSAVVALPIVPV